MATTFASLGLGGLTPEQKAELIGELWDDLAATVPAGGLLTAEQREELKRRQAEAAAHPDDWVSWEQVREEVLGSLPE